ncbi:hypothetical protein [Marinobacter sp. ELB17]|uniref:hypothetical protein n=1 Tax=Marinobacter sp. ELB17 TaxID=270374 RepID=UPI0000F3617D|nr:hypothetical protein [Marinobacter sp. ELB17]EAZ97662.1 hypothetical protein MELB17_24057 [Marinobacter sp. ELB17]
MTDDKNHLPFGHLSDELTMAGGIYATPELSKVLNMARGGYRPEVDMQKLIDGKFTTGEGVLIINPDLDDAAIATDIRRALEAAKGKPFRVVQAPGSIKD